MPTLASPGAASQARKTTSAAVQTQATRAGLEMFPCTYGDDTSGIDLKPAVGERWHQGVIYALAESGRFGAPVFGLPLIYVSDALAATNCHRIAPFLQFPDEV